MKATVSEKGQVTIPKVLREELGIHPGEVLEFEAERGRLVGRKASARDRVAAVYGVLRGRLPEGVDTYIREARGPGPDE